MSATSHDSHEHARGSVFARRPLLSSIAVGIGTLLPHAFLPAAASVAYAAVVMALIAGVYFGFAVMNGNGRDQLVEFTVTGLFTVTALLGLLFLPLLLPLAYLAHAAWDFAHHARVRLPLVAIPQWYVPWCVIVDVLVGAGLLLIWRHAGII